ncbi:hypothetical protein OUZ56_016486 [Daphnia magna]|uniref:Uncharacterized protein n=1 Tax=Daphnia magna TaxID=35525 RepID=A0ABR0AQT5_9CRUS|nr:hypothetical protein OUZ56_016486 [Daphnia magna]
MRIDKPERRTEIIFEKCLVKVFPEGTQWCIDRETDPAQPLVARRFLPLKSRVAGPDISSANSADFIALNDVTNNSPPRFTIMADPTADDDEESHTEDPRVLKVLRANAKRRFTILINLVRDLMADHGSRTSIKTEKKILSSPSRNAITTTSATKQSAPTI